MFSFVKSTLIHQQFKKQSNNVRQLATEIYTNENWNFYIFRYIVMTISNHILYESFLKNFQLKMVQTKSRLDLFSLKNLHHSPTISHKNMMRNLITLIVIKGWIFISHFPVCVSYRSNRTIIHRRNINNCEVSILTIQRKNIIYHEMLVQSTVILHR